MSKQVFALDVLNGLDNGKIGLAWSKLVSLVTEDCIDRPGEKGARKVTLSMIVKPDIEEGGNCETVLTGFEVSSSLPKMKSKAYSMEPRRDRDGGQLIVNDASLKQVKQMSLTEAQSEGAEGEGSGESKEGTESHGD